MMLSVGSLIVAYSFENRCNSSFLPYYEADNNPQIARDRRIEVPTAIAVFPKDIVPAPREFAERFFNIQQWTKMPSGGHFAALEEPELLVEDIRSFFRPLRSN
jgi:pimeloyl-ACP methyl ester carboxylesterase